MAEKLHNPKDTFFKTSILIVIFLILNPLTYSFGQTSSRKTIQLKNGWKFTRADRDIDYISLTKNSWTTVTLPHTWNNLDIQSGDKVSYGTGWYKRELIIKKNTGKQYFLKFNGVGQYAKLYINNQFVGKHLGGYSAFIFNITGFLNENNTNLILVKVNNELNDSYPKDNFLFGIYGGIYREVSLITTNDLHIGLTDHASSGIYVHQKSVTRQKATLKIISMLKNESSDKKLVIIKTRLISKRTKIISESKIKKILYPGGLIPLESELIVNKPRLWKGKKDPYLYNLETLVIYNNKVVDIVNQKIGIRSFSIDPEQGFILNGKPYKLYGVCRHQEWQNLGNALLPEHEQRDIDLINEIGATSIRLAHYQQSENIYTLADSTGLLVWAEIPFVNGYHSKADSNARQQLTELIKQNFNHPSIFVWGVHNEVIKGKIIQGPVNLTRELHNLAKELDRSRYTVAVSNIWWAYNHKIHENTDLQGFNQYTGWYGGKPAELEKWINKYHNSKPDIRFSVSEYGAGGNIAHQTHDLSPVPKPTGQFFPETYQTYYHEITYSAIEKSPFIWASYIWNMFDFSVPEWNRGGIKGRNHKGLITYDRKVKKDAFYWYKANWSKKPVLYLTGRRNNSFQTEKINFKAYCNFDIPVLYLNGKKYGKMNKGINRIQFVIKNFALKKGAHKIEIKAKYRGKTIVDGYNLTVGKPLKKESLK